MAFQELAPFNKHVHHSNSLVCDCSGYWVQNKIMTAVERGIVQSWWKIIWLLQLNILFNSGLTIVASVVKCWITHQFTVMFEALKSVVLKIQGVWDVLLCCWKSWTAYEHENTTILQSGGNYSPNSTASHPGRHGSPSHILLCTCTTHCSQWHYMTTAVIIQWQWHYVPTAINMMATFHQYLIQCADSNSLVYHET